VSYQGFVPDFRGDNDNRQWVRRRCAEQGIRIEFAEVLKRAPAVHIRRMFDLIIDSEWDWEESTWR
jgi:hypothetical protein